MTLAIISEEPFKKGRRLYGHYCTLDTGEVIYLAKRKHAEIFRSGNSTISQAMTESTAAWALDEIKDLDIGNVEVLMSVLRKNNITLVSACPDPDVDVLAMFKNRRSIRSDRVIYDPSGALAHRLTAPVGDEVLSDV